MKALTVKQLNMYVKSLLDSDENLSGLWVTGEISNYNRNARSGHAYFSIKDADCAVKTVMFNSAAASLKFTPKDGMRVFIFGRVTLYERDGAYQLYAEKMIPDGIGAEYLAFLQLRDKLSAEGLFDAAYKKPLPSYPRTIGVITSKTGAAVHDVLSVALRRYPIADIVIYPCSVQGADCAESVIRGIGFFDKVLKPDVILITRGGGSYEDLSGFNDEALARAVFAAKTPVVSAIGHDVDFTVLDFVADMRAPTPSAAAELITPDCEKLKHSLDMYRRVSRSAIASRLENERSNIDALLSEIDPSRFVLSCETALDKVCQKTTDAFRRTLSENTLRLSGLTEKINALSPLATLSRGFCIATNDGKTVRKKDDVKPNDKITLLVKDGEISCVAE